MPKGKEMPRPVTALKVATKWKSIMTVPKDGTPVLLFRGSYLGDNGRPTAFTQTVGAFLGNELRTSPGRSRVKISRYTHWMPLPSEPTREQLAEVPYYD